MLGDTLKSEDAQVHQNMKYVYVTFITGLSWDVQLTYVICCFNNDLCLLPGIETKYNVISITPKLRSTELLVIYDGLKTWACKMNFGWLQLIWTVFTSLLNSNGTIPPAWPGIGKSFHQIETSVNSPSSKFIFYLP